MAIYRFSVQVLSRKQGRSVVAAAAYRAGEKLVDALLGVTSDYTKKPGIEHTEIVAPSGAPGWVFERERLWNAVNYAERYKTARLAREVQIALPVELSRQGQLELTRAFVQDTFVSQGMVADIAIHREDRQNPHAHVLLTTREIGPEGFGVKRRDWDRKTLLFEWREAWEYAANRALAQEGHAERIDCRSYDDRGLDLVPQPKLFRDPDCADQDARDHVRERSEALLRTKRRNGAHLLRHPEQAFELLTASGKRPSFTQRDLEKLADRHSASTEQYHELLSALRSSPEVVALGTDQAGLAHFSTCKLVALEQGLLTDAHLLAQRPGHEVDEALVHQALAQARSVLGLSHDLTDEQAAAVCHVTTTGDFALVEGYAGTGKSTMLAAARLAWEAQGYEVVGAALAGKAAYGLRESAGIPSRTLASWQWNWELGNLRLTPRHVLVIDEAGMVGTERLAEVLAEVRRCGAKAVVVGDTRQLQAIDPGAPMRLLKTRYGAATLSKVIRQRAHAWQREATLAFAQQRAPEALRAYVAAGRVHPAATADAAQDAMVRRWDTDRRSAPTRTAIMLAFRRVDVRALNEKARALRVAAGEIGEGRALQTERGERSFAPGDRIYFLRNDRDLGVKNGTLGTVEAMSEGTMLVRLDEGKQIVVDTDAYSALDHGYAGTIHKSQGVTVDQAYVFASRYMDASASYVAMSRHRQDAHLFFSSEEFATFDALIERIGRSRKVEMAHEVADRLGSTALRQEDRRLAADAAFLKLSPSEQISKLEALRWLGQQEPRAAEELLRADGELRAATERCRQATSELSEATNRLAAFEAAHPQEVESRSAEHQHHLARVQRLTQQLRTLERTLTSLRREPARWERAREAAQKHNRRIRAAQVRWRQLRELKHQAERAQVLQRFADAANAKAGKEKFRVAGQTDEGRLFDQLTTRKLAGSEVLVLRDREGGPLVFAYADHCGDERGMRLVRGPRSRPTKAPSRDRGPERG